MALRAVPTPQWHTTRVLGSSVRYLEAGQGEPFVFLHGWGLTPRAYAGGVTRLCQAGIRVIAPTLPGFGGSSPLPVRETTVEGYAARVADFVDHLALPVPVFLAGHSLGGGVALQLAVDRPDLVRSLTLVNSVGGSPGGRTPRPDDAMTSRPWWQWAIGAVTEVDPRGLPTLLPTVLRDLLPNVVRHPVSVAAAARAALAADLADEAGELIAAGLPVLFIWGDRDRLTTPGAFAQVVSAMPPEVIEGRHGWLLTDPEAFSQLMHNAVVVHAMLERTRRGQVVVVPKGIPLADLIPPERRRRSRALPLPAGRSGAS